MNDKCPQSDLLAGYALNDGLSAAERGTVAAHLAACPACAREVATLQNSLGLVASRVDDSPVPDLRDKVLAEVAARRKVIAFPRRAWVPALAAAALLFALVGHSLRPAVTDGPAAVAVAPAPVAADPVAGTEADISFSDAELAEIFEAEDRALWREMDELALAMDEAALPETNDEV